MFAECDISVPDNEQFLLDPESVSYPNIVMLLRDVVVSFDRLKDHSQSMTEMVKYLSGEYLKLTNFWVLQVTCDQLYSIIAQNFNFLLYVGSYSNLGVEMPMEFFTQA